MVRELKLRHSVTLVLFLASSARLGSGQVSREFHRAFAVSPVESVSLRVDFLEGDLRIGYARDGEITFSVAAEDSTSLDLESLSSRLVMTQTGNSFEIWERPGAGSQNLRLTYAIDVPYRTEVHGSVRRGKQTITGIMGPVSAETGIGDIEVSYISLGVVATARTGNLNFEVVGGKIEAHTGHGAIACQRASQGIEAETGDGNISLAVVGDSTAVVKSGNGRIDVGGTHGILVASTSAGDLHVEAVPHEDWQLQSLSGTVRVELPPAASFELDAATTSGQLTLDRDDLAEPDSGVRHCNQRVKGGRKRIQVRSNAGNIVIR
jgi:hypothetical protein